MITEQNKPIFEPSEEDLKFTAQERTRGRTLLKFNLAIFNYFCVGVLIAAGIGYLALSNKLISRGFAINSLKSGVNGLNKENRQLELNAMNLQSYNQINERIARLGMVTASGVEYLDARGAEMAMR